MTKSGDIIQRGDRLMYVQGTYRPPLCVFVQRLKGYGISVIRVLEGRGAPGLHLVHDCSVMDADEDESRRGRKLVKAWEWRYGDWFPESQCRAVPQKVFKKGRKRKSGSKSKRRA